MHEGFGKWKKKDRELSGKRTFYSSSLQECMGVGTPCGLKRRSQLQSHFIDRSLSSRITNNYAPAREDSAIGP